MSRVSLAPRVYPCLIFPSHKWVLIPGILGLQVTTKVFLGSTEMNPSVRPVQMPLLETSRALTVWLAGLTRSDSGVRTVELIQVLGLP